jgi:fructan beta-fructosidase
MVIKSAASIFVGLALVCSNLNAADDVLIEDFEAGSYGKWTVTGDAFGTAPANGTLPNQMPVSGYLGNRFINTFLGGDKSTGTATSPEFTVQRSHVAFLIGGGSHAESLGVQLLVNGEVVRTATGSESEDLLWASWDVSDLKGQKAQLRIFDNEVGQWGHLNIDQFVQTDSPPQPFDLTEELVRYRQQPDYMNEPLRPQFHFSPEINWMNDPNGLVYHDGEYHLFHQYNPVGNAWGHMSWGHAVSRDLTHWQHLPIAIPEANGIMAFSGSCVVDHKNSSGFGVEGKAPMVAIYTGHGHGEQVQNLAYSNDNGRSWTQYAQNPVLDLNKPDFRDPKVFWHGPTNRWIMVVSLAVEKVIVFYASEDLKNWQELSRFGPAGNITKSNWECPDLFELPVDGDSANKLWVLEVDMGAGAVAGGSGGEYFVGHWDGVAFKTIQHAQWVDYGRDFYAPVSWENIPAADGRRIWIGWFNNWETCLGPTSPWRSCMSIPRSLSLKKVAFNNEEPATYVLNQTPIDELKQLRSHTRELDASIAAWPPMAVTEGDELRGMTFELEAVIKPGDGRSIGFRIRTGDDEYTEVAYDHQYSGVYVDRTKSGNVDFHPAFAGRHTAPARVIDGEIVLHAFVDRSTIEVFINGGEAVISDLIFPTVADCTIEVFAGSDSAKFSSLKLHTLKSSWRKPPAAK